MPLHLPFPLSLDARGRTARVDVHAHVRGLVEAVLFTSPGERVGRPDFGSGLRALVFGAVGEQVAAAVGALVHGSLQRWLLDVVDVVSVEATSEESTLRVTVRYVVRATGEAASATFGGDAGTGGGP